jgi:hypothetical protein
MTTLIKLRQTNTPGRVPTTGQLEFGEAALNTADGKLFIKKAEFANTSSFAVSFLNSGGSDWIVQGTDRTGPIVSLDGNISIQAGDTLTITNNASGHPLYLKTVAGTGTDDQIFNAIGQGAQGGSDVVWIPNPDQVGTYYYQCSVHSGMVGTITVSSGTVTESIVEFSADPQDILNLIKTVDGANSGLDSDLLDGQSGEYYLDYNNFTNVPPATLDLTLNGKVTGNAFSNTGVMTLTTELANTGVTAGTYGSASLVPILTIDEDGRITVANTTSVAGVSATNWYVANNTFVIQTADGGVFKTPIDEFTNLTVNGDITVTGTVDGRDIAADGIILDGLASATTTVNLSGKVTGSAVSNNGVIDITTELANTGVIAGTYGSASQIPIITVDEDGRVTLLSNTAVAGVESFTWETANNTLRLETGDGTVRFVNVDNFTNLTVNGDIIVTGDVDGRDISVDGAKLDLIEDGATADQTATEILNALKTVDGPGSGLNADLLDGANGDYYLEYSNFTNVPDATFVLNQIKTVDGIGSGLDADLLDGLHASEILSQAANSAASQIGDGSIQIVAGDALIGGGTFTTNQFTNQVITINHEDVSAQANVDNADGSVLQDINFDTFGHVVGVSSIDLDTRYYTETELDNGQLDNRYYTETESDGRFAFQTITITGANGLTGGGDLSASRTISHADTSSQANVVFANTSLAPEFIESVSFDDFGHVVSVTKGIRNYLDQATADARYVNVTGDTMTGDLEVQADIIQDYARLITLTASSSSVFPALILQWTGSDYSSGELTITATTSLGTQISKMLIVHDGTTAYATEFGNISTTANDLASFDVGLGSGNVNVVAVNASATPTTYKIFARLVE